MSTTGNFSVVVRVRPADVSLKSCVKITGNTVAVAEDRHGRENDKLFAFDKVFAGPAKQEQMFMEVTETVDAVPNGFHGCIFAYGPTGSGKTHTIMGSVDAPGIVPRAINRIFDSLSRNVRLLLFMCFHCASCDACTNRHCRPAALPACTSPSSISTMTTL